jgi:hypothetical protein
MDMIKRIRLANQLVDYIESEAFSLLFQGEAGEMAREVCRSAIEQKITDLMSDSETAAAFSGILVQVKEMEKSLSNIFGMTVSAAKTAAQTRTFQRSQKQVIEDSPSYEVVELPESQDLIPTFGDEDKRKSGIFY